MYNLIPSDIDFKQTHKIGKFIWTKQDQKAFGDKEIEYTLDNTGLLLPFIFAGKLQLGKM